LLSPELLVENQNFKAALLAAKKTEKLLKESKSPKKKKLNVED